MVCGSPFMAIELPTAEGSPPSRSRQNAWETMATAGPAEDRSDSPKSWPRTGLTPRTRRKSTETSRASYTKGRPSAKITASPGWTAAMDVSVVVSLARSRNTEPETTSQTCPLVTLLPQAMTTSWASG